VNYSRTGRLTVGEYETAVIFTGEALENK
jgi:hypothetical protein